MQPVILSHQTENKSMMDQELKKQLDTINENIVALQVKGGWWKSFLTGMMSGIGSIIGVVIALTLIGWLLNIAGVIPAFRKEADQWKQLIEEAQQQRLPSKTQTTK